MEHNRMLQISTAGNRKATYWPKSEILWSDFTDKLKTPVRGMETLDQYLALPKSRAGRVKGRRRICRRDLYRGPEKSVLRGRARPGHPGPG